MRRLGDHFTPREVIRLMAHLVYTGEEDVYRPGVFREIYDPACGTGGMLSVSEENDPRRETQANLALFGQDYNDEAWAICCSDMLIKDEATTSSSATRSATARPATASRAAVPLHARQSAVRGGVEGAAKGRREGTRGSGLQRPFRRGLPAINDGSLLFLQHMMSKMQPAPEGTATARRSPSYSTARPCSAAMPGPGHPTSGAGSSRMTG